MTFETRGAPRPLDEPQLRDAESARHSPRTPSSASEGRRLTSSVMAEVLVVEGHAGAGTMTTYLRDNGVTCDRVPECALGLRRLLDGGYDAGIIDAGAAGSEALGLLRRLREKSAVPVIVLTDRSAATARADWLDAGADDSLSKPVSPRELLARLRAILRRRHARVIGEGLQVGPLALDLSTGSARVGTHQVDLTPVEFELLAVLARRVGCVVPRSSLLGLVGRRQLQVSERTVDVHIARLRKKLGAVERGFSKRIGTVRGLGYVLAIGL